MRCRHFFSFVLVVFSVFCFGLFTTQNSYAVDDISVIIRANNSVRQWDDVFSTCTGDCLNDYSYLIVSGQPYFYSTVSTPINFYFRADGSFQRVFTISGTSPFSIYKLPFDGHSNNFLSWGSGYSFENDVTLTLTDSYQSCPPSPSGDLSITENGTYDVTNYSSATVNVSSSEVVQGDYHQDLVNINQSIIVCGAILLVLYFFYCIYRLIIKNSGVH